MKGWKFLTSLQHTQKTERANARFYEEISRDWPARAEKLQERRWQKLKGRLV